MAWWEATLYFVGVLAFWPAFAVVGEICDRAFQRRMDVTLWSGPKVES